jgi:hypothetical protein
MAPPPGGAIESAPTAPPPPPGETTPLPGNKHLHHRGRIIGDPHFFGKHGERFDFHGRSNRDYCVLTDKDLQINMHLFRGVRKGSTVITLMNFCKVFCLFPQGLGPAFCVYSSAVTLSILNFFCLKFPLNIIQYVAENIAKNL